MPLGWAHLHSSANQLYSWLYEFNVFDSILVFTTGCTGYMDRQSSVLNQLIFMNFITPKCKMLYIIMHISENQLRYMHFSQSSTLLQAFLMLVTDKQCIVLNTPSCNLISLYFLNSFILDGSLFALFVGRREEHPACRNRVMRCLCGYLLERGSGCLHMVWLYIRLCGVNTL